MQGEKEQERWREIEDVKEVKSRLLDQMDGWTEGVRDLVAKSDNVTAIGLYDRPELAPEHWYHGRCVLAGDAAHPTRSVNGFEYVPIKFTNHLQSSSRPRCEPGVGGLLASVSNATRCRRNDQCS